MPEDIPGAPKPEDELDDLSPEERKEAERHRARAEKQAKMGHKRFMPHDYSGPDPSDPGFKGAMAPALAGERAKAMLVIGRVIGFIEKYSEMAVQKFPGYAAHTIPGAPGGGKARGGTEKTMSKERAIKLVEALPMMPSSQAMAATRAIAHYIWRIHATFRELARGHTQKMTAQVADKSRAERRAVAHDIRKDIEEFEADSVNIKGDINVLSAAAGTLKRSGGFGGQADKVFLQKVIKGYVDDSGQFHIKSISVEPKEPSVPLPPELQKLSSYEAPPLEPKVSRGPERISGGGEKLPTSTRAPGGAVDKTARARERMAQGLPPSEWFKDWFERELDTIAEAAEADFVPKWWNDL